MSISLPFKPALLSGAVSLFAISAALPALSQELIDIGEVVVTPNRTPTEKSKVGSTVNTIDEETIEAQSLPAVTDYLTLLPGVATSSPGGQGQEVSLTIRGADKKYIKTLFNGIDISDPTSTQVQTSYQHLLAAGINGIEVLKGSQSTLYGSDAIGGVVGIRTLGGLPLGVRHTVFAEGGSLGSVLGGYKVEAGLDRGEFALSVAGLHTDGISAADEAVGNSERDSYDNITGTFAGEYTINENISVFGSGIFIRAENELDGFSGTFPYGPTDDLDDYSTSEQVGGRVGVNIVSLDGRMTNTVSAQIFDISRETFGDFTGTFEGQRQKVDYQGTMEFNPVITGLIGLDWEQSEATTTTGISDSASIAGVWAQAIFTPIEPFTLTLAGRYDHHEFFGGYTTWRITGAYNFAEAGTTFRASVASGFRAPSLYELYAPEPYRGNPNLEPETTASWDVGVEQEFLDGRLVASFTYFQLAIEDLIDFEFSDDFSEGQYVQVAGTSKRRGIEAGLVYSPSGWLDLGASYTYLHALNPERSFLDPQEVIGYNRAIRVPRHSIALTAAAQPWEKWTFSAAARIAVDTVDTGGFKLDDYVLVNAKVAYKPTDDTELYLRVENLLDQDYQTVRGFGTPGLSAYAGFKAVF